MSTQSKDAVRNKLLRRFSVLANRVGVEILDDNPLYSHVLFIKLRHAFRWHMSLNELKEIIIMCEILVNLKEKQNGKI